MNNKYGANLSFSNKNKKGRKADDAFIQEEASVEEAVLPAQKEVAPELNIETIVEEPLEAQENAPESIVEPEAAKETQAEEEAHAGPRTVVSMYDITPEGHHISAQDMKMRRVLVERPRLNRRLKGGR